MRLEYKNGEDTLSYNASSGIKTAFEFAVEVNKIVRDELSAPDVRRS